MISALIIVSAAYSDDHIIVERTRSGLGIRFPAVLTEIWLSDSATYIKEGGIITIRRYDSEKRWNISLDKKLYFEASLNIPAERESAKDTSIQRMGWRYEPVYEWVVKETEREESVNGFPCRLVVAEADADYSSESIELWVTDQVKTNVERFNQRVTPSRGTFDWQDVVKSDPGLRKRFVMKYSDKKNYPIAPEMTFECVVTKAEVATPPPNIYDLPQGLKRVNSLEEIR